jgi:hypothetical protein
MDATTDRLLVLKGDGLVRPSRTNAPGPRPARPGAALPPGLAALRARAAPRAPSPRPEPRRPRCGALNPLFQNTSQKQYHSQVRLFDASYTDYLELLEDERRASEAAGQAASAGAAAAAPQGAGGGPANGGGGASSSSGGGAAGQNGAAAAASNGNGSGSGAQNGKAKGGGAQQKPKKRTLGIFERQEFQKLEKEIEDLGRQRDALNARLMELGASGAPAADVGSAALALAEVDAREQAASERWLELAEIAGDI